MATFTFNSIYTVVVFSIIYNIHSASLAHYEQKKSGRAPSKNAICWFARPLLENVLPCPTRPIYNPGLQIYDPGLRLRAAAAAAEGVGMRRA